MISKISPRRGRNPIGLALYLFGPGRHNEHQDPHVVAADGALGLAAGQQYTTAENHREIVDLGHALNAPFQMFGTDFNGGHIWHCSLSLPTGEHLSDEQWAQVARGAMDALGFTEASGKAACRWVAVRHGLSTNGNDHIHIVVNLIREDGTKASIWNDRRTMSRYVAQVERELGLTVVDGRAGAGMPGLTRAELERQERTGAQPARIVLARAVRAAAVAAADEAEFVRRLRGTPGVLVRPRYVAGSREQIVGYSVAVRPGRGERAVWYGGGRLGSDLTLPRLRSSWIETSQPEAVATWQGHSRMQGREARVLRSEAWAEASAQVDAAAELLARVPLEDYATWAGAAREAAGIFAALAARSDVPYRLELERASDSLARSGIGRHWQPRPARTSEAVRAYRGVQMVAVQAGPVGHSNRGEASLIASMMRTVAAIERSHALRGEASKSARLKSVAEGKLAALHAARAARPASAIPTQSPDRRPPGRLRGPERGFDR